MSAPSSFNVARLSGIQSNCLGHFCLRAPVRLSPSYSLLTEPTPRPARASTPLVPTHLTSGLLPRLQPTRPWAAAPPPIPSLVSPRVGSTTAEISRRDCATSF